MGATWRESLASTGRQGRTISRKAREAVVQGDRTVPDSWRSHPWLRRHLAGVPDTDGGTPRGRPDRRPAASLERPSPRHVDRQQEVRGERNVDETIPSGAAAAGAFSRCPRAGRKSRRSSIWMRRSISRCLPDREDSGGHRPARSRVRAQLARRDPLLHGPTLLHNQHHRQGHSGGRDRHARLNLRGDLEHLPDQLALIAAEIQPDSIS